MKKKQFIIFILLILALFIINKIFLNNFLFNINSQTVDTDELVNTQKATPQQVFDDSWAIIKSNYVDAKLNEQDWNRWKKHYKNKIKTNEDATVAINTILESLDDPYSRYLDKTNYLEQFDSINSKITGIGVNIAAIGGKTYVVSVLEDTPAYKAGLKTSDILLKVNDKSISGMKISEVANIVRGPEGSKVKLTLLRNKKYINRTIIRSEIKIKTVKSSIEKNNIGYIKILSFIGSTTPTEFYTALDKTSKTNGLIIDLRGNSGGLLPNAIAIANAFIDNQNIVSIVGRNGHKQRLYAQKFDYSIHKPVVVLVDGGSASASEILSGALKDYHVATLIGTTTFGKGMVQKIIPMPNQTGINLTIAKYLTPAGNDINKKGIAPDIIVKTSLKDIKSKKDVQLEKAETFIYQKVKKNS